MIEPDDIIIIDTGSTTEYIAKYLPDDIPITVLCYTLNVLLEVFKKKNCRPIFSGGFFHDNTYMFESPEGVTLIKRSRVNKAFLSASGISHRLGVTCANYYELETKKAALQSSQSRYLVSDASKFGRVRSTYFAELTDFDAVITDKSLPSDYEKLILDQELKLIKA
jgi:DeoR family deoxyribose operon repressor